MRTSINLLGFGFLDQLELPPVQVGQRRAEPGPGGHAARQTLRAQLHRSQELAAAAAPPPRGGAGARAARATARPRSATRRVPAVRKVVEQAVLKRAPHEGGRGTPVDPSVPYIATKCVVQVLNCRVPDRVDCPAAETTPAAVVGGLRGVFFLHLSTWSHVPQCVFG